MSPELREFIILVIAVAVVIVPMALPFAVWIRRFVIDTKDAVIQSKEAGNQAKDEVIKVKEAQIARLEQEVNLLGLPRLRESQTSLTETYEAAVGQLQQQVERLQREVDKKDAQVASVRNEADTAIETERGRFTKKLEQLQSDKDALQVQLNQAREQFNLASALAESIERSEGMNTATDDNGESLAWAEQVEDEALRQELIAAYRTITPDSIVSLLRTYWLQDPPKSIIDWGERVLDEYKQAGLPSLDFTPIIKALRNVVTSQVNTPPWIRDEAWEYALIAFVDFVAGTKYTYEVDYWAGSEVATGPWNRLSGIARDVRRISRDVYINAYRGFDGFGLWLADVQMRINTMEDQENWRVELEKTGMSVRPTPRS
jgi:hypothetical protein